MNSNPTPPRDLSPMWLDLSHVIAGLPMAPAPQRPVDAPPRRGPPSDELPADQLSTPAPASAARWALTGLAQLAAAGAMALLLRLIC
jgi:hypothetical protein